MKFSIWTLPICLLWLICCAALSSPETGPQIRVGDIRGVAVGQLPYDDGAELSYLGANSSATRKFLTQTGTGTAGAAPLWSTIASSDLPSAGGSSLGALQLAGDLGGTAASPKVVGLQGVGVSSSAPATNQVLAYNGTAWAPATSSATSLPALTGSNQLLYDSGTGTVGKTSGITFPAAGELNLNPTSTTATVIGGTMPASFTGNLLNFEDSSGDENLTAFQLSGGQSILQMLSRSGTGVASAVRLGNNSYAASGNALGAIGGGTNASGSWTASGEMDFVASQAHSSTSLGTNINLKATPNGSTAETLYWQFTSQGSFIANATGSSVSPSATDGFIYIASGSGVPTGTPTSFTGARPLYYDSTDGVLYHYTGSAWVDAASRKVTAAGNAPYTMQTTDGIITFAYITTGKTITLCDNIKYSGKQVTIIGPATVFNGTIAPAGSDIINNNGMTGNITVGPSSASYGHYVNLLSAGNGTWYVVGGG